MVGASGIRVGRVESIRIEIQFCEVEVAGIVEAVAAEAADRAPPSPIHDYALSHRRTEPEPADRGAIPAQKFAFAGIFSLITNV
jgi:hypothetical protein